MSAPAQPHSIAAVVLAAGLSSRMGRNKLLLEPGGEALVRRAVRCAQEAGLSPVYVVTGHEREEVEARLAGLGCTFVFNPSFARGMNTSIRAGFRALPDACEGAVVLLGDMPFVTAGMVRALVERFRERPVPPPVVLSFYGEVVAPPILYGKATFAGLRALADDAPGKAVLEQHKREAASVQQPEEALRDLDVPADLEAARLLLDSLPR
jgi:molybdenum cofactor cytidylyltransferase